MSTRFLKVYDVPFSINEEELSSIFSVYGDLHAIEVMRKPNGHSKGYAIMKYENVAAQERVLQLKKFRILGKKIKVKALPLDGYHAILEALRIMKQSFEAQDAYQFTRALNNVNDFASRMQRKINELASQFSEENITGEYEDEDNIQNDVHEDIEENITGEYEDEDDIQNDVHEDSEEVKAKGGAAAVPAPAKARKRKADFDEEEEEEEQAEAEDEEEEEEEQAEAKEEEEEKKEEDDDE